MRFKTFLENVLLGKRKFISLWCDNQTSYNLKEYCLANGLDISMNYDKNIIDPDDFKFHSTIFYSTSRHKDLEPTGIAVKTTARPLHFEFLGKDLINEPILVLKIQSDDISNLRKMYIKDYNMKDEWPSFKPHITLSYNGTKNKEIDLKTLPLPDFSISYNMLTVKNIKDDI